MATPEARLARRRSTRSVVFTFCALVASLTLFACNYFVSLLATPRDTPNQRIQHLPFNAQQILSQCASLRATVGPPESFSARKVSDRYEPGTNSTLIRNANIWTGARNGTETVKGDVLLEGAGLVERLGLRRVGDRVVEGGPEDLVAELVIAACEFGVGNRDRKAVALLAHAPFHVAK